MPYLRHLKSGLWQATVRGPDGKRHTATHRLKSVVRDWARDRESKIANGTFRDPRAGHVTVEAWHGEWMAGRRVEDATASQDASTWRRHVRPKWGTWQLWAVDVEAVAAWDREMADTGVGPHARIKALNYLSAMLSAAVPKRIPHNPVQDVARPRTPLRAPFYWTRDEVGAILTELDGQYRTLVDLVMHVGLRPGEVYGLPVRNIDWERDLIHVTQVATRRGLKAYPKSRRSYRTAPIPPHLVDALYELVVGRGGSELVFTAPNGGLVDDGNFRDRVFTPALEAARTCDCPPQVDEAGNETRCGRREHRVRRGSPNDMRHTAASHLVIDGVDLYRVQALLGHESFATTQRYAHLEPDRFTEVVNVWRKPGEAEDCDAPVTHEGESGDDGDQGTGRWAWMDLNHRPHPYQASRKPRSDEGDGR